MAVLHVVQLGHPVLRRKAELVPAAAIADPFFQKFIDDMIETMDYLDGVGLAGNQVAQPLRIAVVRFPGLDDDGGDETLSNPVVFINPVMAVLDETSEEGWEGCLSLGPLRGMVPRRRAVGVDYLDRQGRPRRVELQGFAARIVQHEFDHLDGVVFADRMTSLATLGFESEFARNHSGPEDQSGTASDEWPTPDTQ
ncbi:MAG: Peptide deformylase [Myxococcota bacterium]|nr:Peptide deformylase [Myxococcota bacterium]